MTLERARDLDAADPLLGQLEHLGVVARQVHDADDAERFVHWRAWAGALLGGIAMGYGARLSNGCNIGAYFSAIAAGNLSGWAWMVLALAGSWIGVRMRPLFSLPGGRAGTTATSC